MLTPSQVAKRAQKGVTTIRNWSTEYADLLSPEARGTNGPRLYSEEDAETLCTIAALRDSGVPPTEVVERMRNQEVPPYIDVTPEPPTSPSNEATEPYQDAPAATFALQTVQSSLQARIDAIERQNNAQWQAIERRLEARERDAIYQAERRGAAWALVFVGFLLLVAWLMTNGAPW